MLVCVRVCVGIIICVCVCVLQFVCVWLIQLQRRQTTNSEAAATAVAAATAASATTVATAAATTTATIAPTVCTYIGFFFSDITSHIRFSIIIYQLRDRWMVIGSEEPQQRRLKQWLLPSKQSSTIPKIMSLDSYNLVNFNFFVRSFTWLYYVLCYWSTLCTHEKWFKCTSVYSPFYINKTIQEKYYICYFFFHFFTSGYNSVILLLTISIHIILFVFLLFFFFLRSLDHVHTNNYVDFFFWNHITFNSPHL